MERLDDEDPLPTKKKRYQSEIAVGQSSNFLIITIFISEKYIK